MSLPPLDVNDIDLTRHAVIEASAGTGKTHTIEKLVLRLVTREQVEADKILVVTFTEKATGELKDRLRAMLERTAREAPEHHHLVQPALDHFDQMPIFTIHGFCQRLLQDYALEQGRDLKAALVDDGDILRSALRDIQRKDWRSHFGGHLRDVLEWTGYCRNEADKWDERVLQIAARFKPRCDHQLRPSLVDDWWRHLGNPEYNIAGQLEVFTIGLLQQYLVEHKRQRGL